VFRSDASVRDAVKSRGHDLILPKRARHAVEHFEIARLQSAPAVQLIARDPFVADVSIKLDQIRGEVRALGREIEAAKRSITELRADTDRNYRFSTFQDTEQRSRFGKLDELAKRYKEMKGRVDSLEGQTEGDYHSYRNFAAVSKKLTELDAIQRDFKNVHLKLQISAGLFCASVLLWLVAVLV
jgi:predicted RNase H-like nuclease (RuvC/YqgF family)